MIAWRTTSQAHYKWRSPHYNEAHNFTQVWNFLNFFLRKACKTHESVKERIFNALRMYVCMNNALRVIFASRASKHKKRELLNVILFLCSVYTNKNRMMALHKPYEILYYDCFHMDNDNLIDHRRSGVVVVDVAWNERNTRLEFFIFYFLCHK